MDFEHKIIQLIGGYMEQMAALEKEEHPQFEHVLIVAFFASVISDLRYALELKDDELIVKVKDEYQIRTNFEGIRTYPKLVLVKD